MTPLPVAPRQRVPSWALYGVLGLMAVFCILYQVRHTYILFFADPLPVLRIDTYDRSNIVSFVPPQSSLRLGDVILRINGLPWRGFAQVDRARWLAKPGDYLRLDVVRNGQPLTVNILFRPQPARRAAWLDWLLNVFLHGIAPWFAVLFGLFVAFSRPRDPMTWLFMVIMLCYSRFFVEVGYGWETPLRQVALFTYGVANTIHGSAFALLGLYFGFRWPQRWVRVLCWALAICIAGLSVVAGLDRAASREFGLEADFLHLLAKRIEPLDAMVYLAYGIFFYCLFGKYFMTTSPDLKRRLRILLITFNVSLGPMLAFLLARNVMGATIPRWIELPVFLAVAFLPFGLAYVMLVHRAVDVGVVVRTGLQYTMARGGVLFLQLIVAIVGIIWAVRYMEDQHHVGPAVHGAILAAYAALLFTIRWISGPLFRWIDRHFFRDAYSSEQLMSELTEKIRNVLEPQELFETVSHRLCQALHINDVTFFLRNGDGFQPAFATGGPAVDAFPPDSPAVRRLADDHEPIQLFLDDPRSWANSLSTPTAERERLLSLNTQVLLPLSASNGLLGFASLGPKRSEAPYTRNDLRLLKAVATQAGLALENSRLATSLAQEAAQKERAHREIEIASEVQQRLFPQKPLVSSDVEIAGLCRPALAVGGDYFDYFRLDTGAYGFAVGDVAGKGLGAALVMATLQASLHTQVLDGDPDIATLIAKLNQVVYDSSTRNRFATLVYGQYDPATRQLTWVNAGHNPPFVLRAGGGVERLALTGIAVGLRRRQTYRQSSIVLAPGDTVVAFTDGISEAMNPGREEFGEDRLQDHLESHPGQAPAALLQGILAATDQFAAGALQHDDMTMVILRIGSA